ncbi:hypothetical protein [Duganella aceris]|uniref:Lipoprotein n=1 Tax=Duganella aceris TaxID=2703883 RepID=A0ABX0FLY4_9BURK|nr:hypothetical protein [Duganella aceris]NGZ85617.1 hypothetical protein [Duganella aceris]
MKKISLLVPALLLAACGNNPPVPDWQMNAQSSIERSTAAYMSGNARIEAAEYQRAREALASTGKVDLMIRAELIRCAAHVAALAYDDCPGYAKLAQDASPADRAYADYLAGRATAADAALLPEQHRAVAAAIAATPPSAGAVPAAGTGLAASSGAPFDSGADVAAANAAHAIADPLSKLVASGVLLRAGKASPQTLADAVDTASAQGWRRPLLAWLGVQAMRAEKSGDDAEAQRIKRRIALVGDKP